MRLILSDARLPTILEEQFYLASKAGISITDSNNIPDFEREIFVGHLMKDIKDRQEALKGI